MRRRGMRLLVVLLPVMLALLHASGAWRMPVLDRLDQIIYDVRLRATMPRTLDERIVIVDLDERSLQEIGHWPWGRDKLARFTQEVHQGARSLEDVTAEMLDGSLQLADQLIGERLAENAARRK